jgi:gluconate 5-dehydrogenase
MAILKDLFSMQGRVAFVTGGSRGLGAEIARGLARAGAAVVLAGRDKVALAERQAALEAEGLVASTAAFDVADETEVDRAIERAVNRHGRLDVLVNNAGMAKRNPLETHPTEDFHRILDVNLSAAFYLSRAAIKPMLANGYGRVINISSIQGLRALRGRQTAYTVSKHALIGLTRSMAREFGDRGVTTNAIAPGFFVTEMTRHLSVDEEFNRWLYGRTPLNRWGKPEELLGAILFLASKAGSYVNGHVLSVDGGMAAS